jgi:hypothetical protein
MTERIARRKAELLSEADYLALLDAQQGTCAICGHPPKTRRLAVDHDHKSGNVRGLLCHFCNRTLATRCTVEWLRSATAYLANHADREDTARHAA